MIWILIFLTVLAILRITIDIIIDNNEQKRYKKRMEETTTRVLQEIEERKKNAPKQVDYTKTSDNRRFKIGDVILYNTRGQQYNSRGNIDPAMEPYTRTGIMLISSFDYDSDVAARCSIGRSSIGLHGTVYGDYAPAGYRYRKAKKHHIKKFIHDICKDEVNCRAFADEIKYLTTLI